MDSHKIAVKLFAEDGSALDAHEVVPVFHSWIQTKAVPNHLVIDVADYAHVHNGPGTCLIAHEANFYTDRADGRAGLMYARKQPFEGSFTDRVKQALAAVLEGAKRLETDPRLAGRIRFKTDEVLLSINDRLNAPSTPETFAAVRGDLHALFTELYDADAADVVLRQAGSEETPFKVEVKSSKASTLDDLLARTARPVNA